MTFRVLVAVPFCIAIALQGLVCLSVLSASQTTSQIDAVAYDLFAERVSSHAGALESDMVFRWSDFDAVANDVSASIGDVLAREGAGPADLVPGSDASLAVIESVEERLIEFSRRTEVDGVYVLLAGAEEEGDALAGLYVRDSNPKVDVANRSDLLLSVCPLSVGKRLDIALDTGWSATFPLAPEGDARSDFYYRPLRAAEQHPDARSVDLGYWGRPVDLGWTGTSSITYSVPLRGDRGNLCGVFGIEVRLDRVTAFLPYRDLDGNGSYVLAVEDASEAAGEGGGRVFEALATTGALQSLYIDEGTLALGSGVHGAFTAMPLDTEENPHAAIVAATDLKLYDETSPFASEQWAVLGMESEDTLFSASYQLERNLLGVYGASLAIGVVIAVLIAWASSSRLRSLMREVRAAKPEQPISFDRTGIVEIDELSDAIQMLGSEVAVAASRLSQILRLSDRSIAAFENNRDTDEVSYTAGFFDTLGGVLPAGAADAGTSEAPGEVGGSLDIREFRRLLEPLAPYAQKEAEGRWIVSDAEGRRWVRFVAVANADGERVYGLVEDVTDEITTRLRLEHERDHDVLTGLLNRRAFEEAVCGRLAQNPPAFAAMLMMDLDNLKYINDTYGHDWGDHYIQAAAQVIERTFTGRGCFARISGDEFLVFVDGYASAQEAWPLFDEFMRALDASVLEAPDGSVLKVRASAGVALYPGDAGDFAHLREYADFAMYEAKSRRKGALLRFDRQSHEEKAFILNTKEDLNRLLDDGLVEYHFQPIVDARTGEVAAFEALMRSQVASIPTPDRILTLARSQSKLYRVEHLTFFGALQAFSRHAEGLDAVLFVNSIATQRLSPDDEQRLRSCYGNLLKRLVIEITESDYSREMAVYKEALAHRFGARLAIDDFGSGSNGETSLLDYHVDFVKLDMGIVRDIDTAVDHQDIARNLVGYAHDRGIRVVAEGVETEAELAAVVKLGVDYVQGFLCGRPAPEPSDIPDDVKRLIRSFSERSGA
ncbi:GGDEF and EAL domain-containing protein [Arabiibacter massiliensis]|uniref:GGDEF and EAL domain-containing protein n=1 Tax=Arabiibacter massiliensis TaxID=1870985 RepID=UPI001E6373E2|nr:GGDEF and EAL domain-containing protein [Arabiibacter massiliensis]